MMTWSTYHLVWRYLVTVLLVAWVTFWGLSWLQLQEDSRLIQSGTIDPDITIEQAIQQIQQLPEMQITTGAEFGPIEVTGQISQVKGIMTGNEIIQTGDETIYSWEKDVVVDQTIIDTPDLDQMVKEVLWSDGQDHHEVAGDNYREKINQLCQIYQSSCAVLSLDGDYTMKQQYSYYVMVIYMGSKLREFGYDPLMSLRNLTINNYTKNKRWYANAKLMVLNTYQMRHNKEFLQVLAHEMWHVVDLGVIVGKSKQISQDYTEFGKAKFGIDDGSLWFYAISWLGEDTMRSNMSQVDFVSWYGMTNPFEDFAECHNMYLYHREVFVYLASSSAVLQRKYDYFNELYQAKYLSANVNPMDLTQLDVGFRPWDTTRM
jgi:hypothetical protein